MTRYVIITPARDEQQHIAATIQSVCEQTVRPVEWIIVDDGSTDQTGSIVDQHVGEHSWLHTIHLPNRGFRKSGGGVMEAFYAGYGALRNDDWDFVVKLDGDLTFSPDYFERCFEYFRQDSRLGIGGGDIYHEVGGELKLEVNPRFHVRGATKIYRKACWKAIAGLFPAAGWDTIDEVNAHMLGWKTYSFADLQVLHHRVTGAADGQVRNNVKHGMVCYVSGYHPLFVAASCVQRLIRKPYVIGSAAICYGFIKGYVAHQPRVENDQLIRYIRGQQLRRLCGLETIWK